MIVANRNDIRAGAIERPMNESLFVRAEPAQVDGRAVEIEFEDIFLGDEAGRAGPRHEISLRIFRIADRDVTEGVDQLQVCNDAIRDYQLRDGLARIQRQIPPGAKVAQTAGDFAWR